MKLRTWAAVFVVSMPAAGGLAGCQAISRAIQPQDRSDGLTQVDDLLGRIEAIQVEAVLSKERARAALDALFGLTAQDFAGDAVSAHAELVAAIERSETQARKLRESVTPAKAIATTVFERWTADLEAFGDSKLRERSQTRMEHARAQCDAVVAEAVSAQIAYDSFNSDLRDHTLFLGHDLNAAAVGDLAEEIESLDERARELDTRLDACAATAKAYVESNALHGQVSVPPASVPANPAEPR